MAPSPPLLINQDAEVRLHEIANGRYCAIVDDILIEPDALVEFAVLRASRFAWQGVPPGPRLNISENELANLHRFIRSRLCRHFPFHRGGIVLQACLANVTLAPQQLSHLQRMCHIDRRASPDRRTYAGVIYLFRNPDLGGTAFYRWKKPEVITEAERLFQQDPAASMAYLEQASAVFRGAPEYMTESSDLAELLDVVPARFNRMVFYDGEAPHSGHITNPHLLTEDLSEGRLSFNFFASVNAQS